MNGYRVARCPKGKLQVRAPGETIPAGHTEIRPATDAEVVLLRRIREYRDPRVEWGQQLTALMGRCHAGAEP